MKIILCRWHTEEKGHSIGIEPGPPLAVDRADICLEPRRLHLFTNQKHNMPFLVFSIDVGFIPQKEGDFISCLHES